MNRFLPVFLVLSGAVSIDAADRPNIVFVIADDCTFRDLGCYGGQAHTPNLDQLANEGMLFSRCFQSAPMCSPTRHSIYTGQFPVKTGAYPNHTFVPEKTKSVVQYLKPLGYRVAHSGKGHVNPKSVFNWESIPGAKNPEFDQVESFVVECKQQETPFCLLLCSNEPHTPWNKGDASRYPPEQIELPPYFVDTKETRQGMSRYLAEITYFDMQVGETVKILDEHDLTRNTLLVVVSEQGSSMPFAKWTCYDNGLQSGCVIRWPGHVKPGEVNPAMIEYVDFLPTFIDVAGGSPPTVLDGESLLPVLRGKQSHKSHVFGEMTTRGINSGSDFYGIRSVRSERFKYIWNFTPEAKFQNACTNSAEFKSWRSKAEAGDADAISKVNRYQKRPGIELYDVIADPMELNNIADDPKYVDVKRELRQRLDLWMTHCGDEGQATEMKALTHMTRNKKAKK
ncbi:MAG: sulfatase [Planctomycetota bacterium]